MPTIADEDAAPPSSNPDDYPALKGHAPGSIAARDGDPLPGWSDQSIPPTARLSSFVRERGRDAEVKWDRIAAEAKSIFGADPAQLRRHVELERAQALADKDQTLSEGDYGTRFVSNLARDLPFSPGRIIEDREYHKAIKAFEEGRHTGQDIGIIANYRARQKRLGNESEMLKHARFGSGLAKMGAEFALGGPVAGRAAAATGMGGLGRFGVETATRALTVPSLGTYEKTFEQAFKAGRTEPTAQDIAQGFTVGLVNSAIAGQVERFGARGLGRLGVTSPAATVPIGAVAGTLEDDVSQAVLKNLNLETRYGPLVELAQGKRGDNIGRLVHSLIGEGIFAGVGALRGPAAFDAPLKLDAAKMQAVIDAGVKKLDAEAEAGKTIDEAAEALADTLPKEKPSGEGWDDGDDFDPTAPDFDAAEMARIERRLEESGLTPGSPEWYRELDRMVVQGAPRSALMPKERDPFEGLSEQEVRDYADVARSKPGKRLKLATVKEQLLADPNVRALLVAEGRLPRPERPFSLPGMEGTDIGRTVAELTDRPPDAQGGNANFWAIPGTDYGLRVRKSGPGQAGKLKPLDDPFPGHNFGQPIATYGDGVQVVRLQRGAPAGMPYKFPQTPEGKDAAVATYRANQRAAAEMPDAAYDQILRDFKTVNDAGYQVDPSKAGNVMIDRAAGRFGLVDVQKRGNKEYVNTPGELAIMLIDNARFYHVKEDPGARADAAAILRKIEAAAARAGEPMTRHKSSSLNYSYQLAGIEPAHPARPDPAPESPPESPQTADLPPEGRTGVPVDESAPEAKPAPPEAALTDRERLVLERRSGPNPKTLEEIAAEMGGITRERVRQIEGQARGKLGEAGTAAGEHAAARAGQRAGLRAKVGRPAISEVKAAVAKGRLKARGEPAGFSPLRQDDPTRVKLTPEEAAAEAEATRLLEAAGAKPKKGLRKKPVEPAADPPPSFFRDEAMEAKIERGKLEALRERYVRHRDMAREELERAFPQAAKTGERPTYARGYDDRVKAVREYEQNIAEIDAKLKALGPAPTAPRARKPKPAAGESLVRAVIDAGGIDPRSAEFLKHFESVGVARANEPSLRRPGLFKTGGRGLDQLAQELHAQGHLPDADPQTLMDRLLARKESDRAADDQGRAARAYEERAARQEEQARAAQTDLFGRPIPKRFGKSGGTQLTMDDLAREAWTQKAREWAVDNELPVEAWSASGKFRAGGQWYEVGKAEDDFPVRRAGEVPAEVVPPPAEPEYRPSDEPIGWVRGEARQLPPIGDNYARPLRDFGGRLYREVSSDDAAEYLPNSTDLSSGQPGRLWFSNTPELATGQGANRGVMLEFEPGDLQGRVSMRKPAAEFAYAQGKAELTTDAYTPDKFRDNLRAVTLPPGKDAGTRRARNFLEDLVRDAGWTREKLPDGRTRYARPGGEAAPGADFLTADAKLDAALAANPELTPQDRAEIHAAVGHVNGMLPAAVRVSLDEAARLGRIDYQFYADHRPLTEDTQRAMLDDPLLERDLASPDKAVRKKAEADRARLLNQMELIRQGKFVGLGSHFEGVVRIDGPGTSGDVTGRYGPEGGALDRAAIAAHEIGHQLGRLFGLDTRADWQAVWAKDIKPRNALTRYASLDAKEGFAEFARLLYGSDVSTAAIRRDFPAAAKFFEKAGLFPAERAGRDGPLDDRFVLKVGTGEYHLDAGRGSLLSRVRDAVGWLEADRPPATPAETAEANRVVDQERAARGEPPLLTAARLSNPEVWDRAMARVAADPDLPVRLTNELTAEPRATTVEENAVLLHRKVTLQNAYRRAATDLTAARESNAPPGDVDRLAAAERNYFEAMDRLDKVLRRTGTEWGRAGQFRRQLAREDYSLGSMLLRAQAAAGRPLTEPERAEITRQQAEIEKAQDRLAAAEVVTPGAFGTPGRVQQPAAPKGQKGDITDLRIAERKARQKFDEHVRLFREANRPLAERSLRAAGAFSGAQRALKTAFDLSSTLRQGGLFALGHPVKAYRAFREALGFIRDERTYDRAMMDARSDPDFPLYQDAGGYWADKDGPLAAQEEAFLGDFWRRAAEGQAGFLSRIPGFGRLAKGVTISERFYTGHLNLIRLQMFKGMVAAAPGGRPTLEQARLAAELVNDWTGRGRLPGSLERAAVPLAQAFFSPRNVASRVRVALAVPAAKAVAHGFRSGDWTPAKAAGLEYARTLIGLGVFYTIAQMLLGDEAEITFDPRSSDFGKVKVGDTRIDPLAGIAQVTTFGGRLVTGRTKDEAGVVTPIRGEGVPAGGRTTAGVLFDFTRSKLAPIPGEAVNVLIGERFDHEPTTAGSVVVGLGVPMSVESILEGFDRLDVPRGTAAGLLNLLGMGVRVYGDRDPGGRAIADVHAMRRRWGFDLGRPPEPRFGTPQTRAMQEAVAGDDYEAFRAARVDFLNRQILAGRTRAQALESFRESADRIDPLEGRLNERDRARFLASRTPEERRRIEEARAVARQRRLKLMQLWARAAAEDRR